MKRNKETKKNTFDCGFSLVEVLLAIVILGLVAAPILQMFVTSAQVNLRAKKTLAATDVANTTMEYLTSLKFDGDKGIGTVMTNTATVTRIPGISYIAPGENLDPAFATSDAFLEEVISTYGNNDGKKVIINNVSGSCLGLAMRSVEYNDYKFDMIIWFSNNGSGTEMFYTYDVTVEVYEPGTITSTEDADGDGENDVYEGVHFVDKLVTVNGAVSNQ